MGRLPPFSSFKSWRTKKMQRKIDNIGGEKIVAKKYW